MWCETTWWSQFYGIYISILTQARFPCFRYRVRWSINAKADWTMIHKVHVNSTYLLYWQQESTTVIWEECLHITLTGQIRVLTVLIVWYRLSILQNLLKQVSYDMMWNLFTIRNSCINGKFLLPIHLSEIIVRCLNYHEMLPSGDIIPRESCCISSLWLYFDYLYLLWCIG